MSLSNIRGKEFPGQRTVPKSAWDADALARLWYLAKSLISVKLKNLAIVAEVTAQCIV